MKWYICFSVAVLVLFSSVVWAIVRGKAKYKSGRFFDPLKILVIGVGVSSLILFIPIYINELKGAACTLFEMFLLSVHAMLRLFIVDGEFSDIVNNLIGAPEIIAKGYTVIFSILFVLAPVLTFGVVLSFFKNAFAYLSYFFHYNYDTFIFSELNEKSIALAESLDSDEKVKRCYVFTDVFEKDDEQIYELVERAKELGAIIFKKDIATIDFSFHSSKKALNFFTMGADQAENISQSLKLIRAMRDRDNTNLYVFSTRVETEILLSNEFKDRVVKERLLKQLAEKSEGKDLAEEKAQLEQFKEASKIKVRRVNEVQSLISRTLYECGYESIFQSALEEGGIRKINAVVIGMGQHGTEMTKALSWFCQMDGYRAEINCFDKDESADDRFRSLCPELMDPKFNGRFDIEGEARYKITVRGGFDVKTRTFDEELKKLPPATYVLIALGDDELNIHTAIKLRSAYKRMGYEPVIQAVVYATEKKDALSKVTNYRGQEYKIDFIGDIKTSYSEPVILDSDVEELALKRHLCWGVESEFWQYDYNYKSSIASAIHKEMKIKCGIPGIEKDKSQRTEEELWAIRILEHRRWNAYMRSEGYVYSGSKDRASRNDLAKTHHCLVPFGELSYEEQIKDDD